MKQILKNGSGINVFDVPIPTPGDNEILIAVEASVISTGTETMDMRPDDKSFLEKLDEKRRLISKVKKIYDEKGLAFVSNVIKQKLSPAEQSFVFKPLGYSNAGKIIAKGRLVSAFAIGDRVACAGAGIASHAEFANIPINLAVKIPKNVNFETAAFTTIGSIALQGIRRANVSFGETIVITGLGLIGLLAVQIAKAWGLVVIGLDINPKRLELAKLMGADYCFSAVDATVDKKIKEITVNGADAVIIYASTRSSEPANQAMKFCRRKGRVVVVGSIGMELQRDEMYTKELDFVMSTSYGPGRYDTSYEIKGNDYPIGYVRWTENRNMIEFLRLASAGKIDVSALISNKFSIDQAEEAYQSLISKPAENISSLFFYPHKANENFAERVKLYNKSVVSGKIKVGIIGAGSFMQENHIPNILRLPEQFEIVAIANHSSANAKSAGEKYKVSYITTDYHEILNDQEIDMVVIGTRHNLHAVQTADAIKAGKHVLVEKPLALSQAELEVVKQAFQSNPSLHVAVGFNRRYSPLIQKAKQIIEQNHVPIAINYRINAGYFSPDHWIQDAEEGGGRIIGEVCHFIDLISYLTGSEIEKMNISHIPLDGKSVRSEDNLIVNFTFHNGSIGVLTYVSIGSNAMEKERIEIFTKGSSMVINDFKELLMFNTNQKDIHLKKSDKGHYKEIEEFANLLIGKSSLIEPFSTDIKITQYALDIIQQMHSSGLE